MKASNLDFNVPVEGVSQRYMPMDKLMLAAKSCKLSDPETAAAMLEYACDCSFIPAKLEYARFLRTAASLTMPQQERYEKAERLLLELLNLLDTPDELTAAVALELAQLYEQCLSRPVGALAMYLKGKRYAGSVEGRKLKQLQHKITTTSLDQLGSHCEDSLALGIEFSYMRGCFRPAELFLREAMEKSACVPEKRSVYGRSCLALAEVYDAYRFERPAYATESNALYQKARDLGFPEYMEVP